MEWTGWIIVALIDLWVVALAGVALSVLWFSFKVWRLGMLSGLDSPPRPAPRRPRLVVLRHASTATPRGGKMNICDFLTEDRILTALGSRDKPEALAMLARLVCESDQQIDHRTLYQALCERERQSSTAFGDGIAVPHARCPGLTQTVAAFARSAKGLEFDSLDGKPTHLFFLLVSPPDPPGRHLKILARISRLLVDPGFRARSMRAESQADLLSLFQEEDERFEHRLSVA